MAATQSMSATMSFDSVLTLSKTADVSFGSLQSDQAGTYTISPSGSVTAANNGLWFGGAAQAGRLVLSGSATQTIGITAANYNASNGVAPTNATCAYDGAAAAPCGQSSLAAPGAGKELKVGVTVLVDGTQAANTAASPTFDIIVNYN